MKKEPRTMERRRFVKLVALSGAAVLAAPLSGAPAAPARSVTHAPEAGQRALTPAVRKEIANQERSLAKTLATIRKFDLPPGSPMAFVFTPLLVRKER
jgi:hypothetical protein